MHIIPPRIHGVIDYLVGALLIVSPWLFGFATNGPAQWTAVAAGAAILIYSLLTDYELGAAPVIPLAGHLGLDVIGGILLTMSPWLFDFADVITWPHVAIGLMDIVVATLTPSYPDRRLTARMQ